MASADLIQEADAVAADLSNLNGADADEIRSHLKALQERQRQLVDALQRHQGGNIDGTTTKNPAPIHHPSHRRATCTL